MGYLGLSCRFQSRARGLSPWFSRENGKETLRNISFDYFSWRKIMKSKPYAYLFGCSLIERCRFFFLERWIWCGVQVMNQSRWYIIYISKMGLLGCCAHEKDRDKGYLGIFEFVFDYSVTWWRVLFFLCSKWQVATCRVYTIRRLNKKIKKEERQFGVGGIFSTWFNHFKSLWKMKKNAFFI